MYFENQLYVAGYGAGKDIGVFDLESKMVTTYSNVYSTYWASGLRYAGSWIANGNMTLFAGFDSYQCYQQSGFLDNPGAPWGFSCDNSIIEGTVISGDGRDVFYANIF